MAENSDFPADVKANCPFKAGRYNFYNVVLKMNKFPKNIAKSGDYIAEGSFYKDDVLILQHHFYLRIVNII
jgi:hypothetical protein